MNLIVFSPGRLFPSISITTGCDLMCLHCRGRFLRGMKRARSPSDLLDIARQLHDAGAIGMLVSGGFRSDGRLPLEPFLSAIKAIKRETDLIINLHPGLVDEQGAKRIASADVDLASVEMIGASRTIREVLRLRARPSDYLQSALCLKEAGIEVVPHITLGIHNGRLLGERLAFEMALELDPNAMVINALIPPTPTPTTRTERSRRGGLPGDDKPGRLGTFKDHEFALLHPPVHLIHEFRSGFSGFLTLGCMYPRGIGYARTARESGFDGVVGPMGLGACCALGARAVWLSRARLKDPRGHLDDHRSSELGS